MTNPERWTPDDVADRLYEVGLGKYCSAFVRNNISGSALFGLNDSNLKEMGFTAANRTTFHSWVGSLHRPRTSKAIDAGKRITTFQPTPPKKTQLASSQNVSNRLFTASLSKKRPVNEYVEYRPRITGAMRYGGYVEDDFDIRDLAFTPSPQVKTIPKRIQPLGSRARRNNKFAVPEEGECDNRSPCRYCGRRFAVDRLPVHESICARSSTRRRKTFNSRKQRTAGYGRTYDPRASIQAEKRAAGRRIGEKPKYVIEHEELIRALRAARMAEASSSPYSTSRRLPKMPKNITHGYDDRVQCPYCGRKFGREQAERHMTFCESNRPVSRAPMTTCKCAKPRISRR